MRMVLGECAAGQPVRLRELAVGRRERACLVELGLVPGAWLRVIARGVAGGLVVAVGDARVALDATTGGSLVVEPAP